MAMDESELIARFKGGDQAAFKLLLQQHLPSLSGYAMRMTSNRADADDIVQETFIRLWTEGHKFDPGRAQLTTWLHNIAHNLCIDHFRKQKQAKTEQYGPELLDDNDPAQITGNTSNAQLVKSALMNIPERQRSAIVMCHYQGLSNKQAAAIIEISVDALESLLVRGRKNLKQQLIDSSLELHQQEPGLQ